MNGVIEATAIPPHACAPQASADPRPARDRAARVTVIEHRPGWRAIDWQELYAYRDLFRFLAWRSIKARYAQSALGIGWAVIQPLFQTLVFTVVFGYIAGLKGDGGAPYSLSTFVALVAWTYFSGALTDGTSSLVANTNLLSKVYFPRLVLPLSAVVSKLVDFGIALVLLIALMTGFYHVAPTWNVLWLPLLVALLMLSAAGMAIWLTTLAVQYRDVKYALTFVVQLLMYASPVIYATDRLPARLDLGQVLPQLDGVVLMPRLIYAVNPMVGVIEGFRSAFLGTRPMPWDYLAIGSVTAILLAASGCIYFRSRERLFADVA
jgi:lipopolysaccharide transport system permease protein